MRTMPRVIPRTRKIVVSGRSFSIGQSFTPVDAGARFWYDPSDLSTLFQDAAGTTPVTTTGQTVRRVNDKSGNALHISNAGANWTLQNDGVNNYLQTDGAVRLQTASSFAWGTDAFAIFAAIRSDTAGLSRQFLQFGAPGVSTGAFELTTNSGGIIVYRRGSGSFGGRETPPIGTIKAVSCVNVTLSGSTHATENPDNRVNGVQMNLNNYGSTDSGSGNFGTHTLLIGGSSSFLAGRIYQIVGYDTFQDATGIANNEAFCASKCGVAIASTFYEATSFNDTGVTTDVGNYYVTSPYSRAKYTTTATELFVRATSTVYPSFPTYAEVALYVDGVFSQNIDAPASGEYYRVVTLSAGSKTLEFVAGTQSSPTQSLAAVLGTWYAGAYSAVALTPVSDTPTNRILFYGDSLTVGGNATNPTSEGYPQLVRDAYGTDSVAVEAFGFRSLYMDCVDATARAIFVAKCAAYSPSIIWLAIGTNDYGLNKWSAANFGTAYAALLDDLHTALPSATIYCQSPIVRTTETANSFGNTLGDYRTQISTAQSTRSSYATYVDGSTILTTGDLADGVHPTTAGHVIYADAVKTELGI